MTATASMVSLFADRTYDTQPPLSQKLMNLRANSEIPEFDHSQDVTIAVLEGLGNLAVGDRTVTLQPGVFVFIPAGIPRTLKVETILNLLVINYEAQPDLGESVWLMSFQL